MLHFGTADLESIFLILRPSETVFLILGQRECLILDFGTAWIPHTDVWDNRDVILFILGQLGFLWKKITPYTGIWDNSDIIFYILGQRGFHIPDFGTSWIAYS